MSILIEGIDLPKNKDEYKIIRIYGNGRTWADKTLVGQAIQIPTPHGRIIDEDEIYEQPHCGECNDATLDAINNAPTILEAEE